MSEFLNLSITSLGLVALVWHSATLLRQHLRRTRPLRRSLPPARPLALKGAIESRVLTRADERWLNDL